MRPVLVHVADIDIREDTGMGRVAWHWRSACENAGWEFVHLGPEEVGPVRHASFFPRAAWRTFQRRRRRADIFFVHEPAAAPFLHRGVRTVVFSHGLERRGWEMLRQGKMPSDQPLRWRSRWSFPLWRLRPCDRGLRQADAVFLINREDSLYAEQYYGVPPERHWTFHNGVSTTKAMVRQPQSQRLRVLFIGHWLARKGIATICEAAELLQRRGLQLEWTLAGVGCDPQRIFTEWPGGLNYAPKIIPRFPAESEATLLQDCDVFILPSFFEGQPLSLLQAMASGRCCITTNCCGQRDLIVHGENGLLHSPGDAVTLSSLIEGCARNPEMRETIGRAATQSVARRTWAAVSAQVAIQVDNVRRNGRIDPSLPPQ